MSTIIQRPVQRPSLSIGAALGVGALAIASYALGRDDPWAVLGFAVMLAVASAVAGGLTGFLFGVPRTQTSDASGEAETAGTTAVGPRYAGNTNLEQISDWLTKILVGATLTQLGAIRHGASDLFDAIGPALGDDPSSAAFGGTLIVYFACLGFIVGWLATRLLLGNAMSESDRATVLLQGAKLADKTGQPERAEEMRQAAVRALAQVAPMSVQVHTVRQGGAIGPPGIQLDDLIAEVPDTTPPAEDGVENRVTVLAMMQADPGLAEVDRIIEAVESPTSESEQYHGLKALLRWVQAQGSIDAGQASRVRDALQRARTADHGCPDRDALSDEILVDLDVRADSVTTPGP